VASRVCLTCNRRFAPPPEHSKRNRCEYCYTPHMREQWQERIADPVEQALRKFRRSPHWQKVQRQVVERDGNRCRGEWYGERCTATTNLSVHHRVPARQLLVEGRDLCDKSLLVTLCRRCHAQADSDLRSPPPPC
jgi:hypothetical protein